MSKKKQPENKTPESSLDKWLFRFLVIGAIIYAYQNYHYHINTIAHPPWLGYSVGLATLLLALFTIAIYAELRSSFGVFAFSIVKFWMVFYFVLGGLALLIFGFMNEQCAEEHSPERYLLKIIDMSGSTSRQSPRVYFIFEGQRQGLSVRSSKETGRLETNPKLIDSGYLEMNCRKALFNSYVVDNYKIDFIGP